MDDNRPSLHNSVKRINSFKSAPKAILKIFPSDYTNSGYDKGHLANCNDLTFSLEVMSSTFYITNIAPQLHSFNAGKWYELESASSNKPL